LGSIASGLGCSDVQDVPLEEVLEFTLELDKVVGNQLSADLVGLLLV